MVVDFYCQDEYVPMHYYEAMQVFSHLFGMPELHPGTVIEPDPANGLYSEGLGCVIRVTSADGSVREEVIGARRAFVNAGNADGVFAEHPELANERNLLKRELYSVLSDIYGYRSPWGVLTGVRPAKVFHNLLKAGLSKEDAKAHFRDFFFVTEEKTDLCAETFFNQERFLGSDANDCCLYISIPFCPTICSYCTFGSSPVARYKGKIDDYVDLLCRELAYTAAPAEGLKIRAVYVGGGTPTSLEAGQLEKVLGACATHFDLSHASEFSVEAGRPDTVTEDKLRVIKSFGVNRISINPQTMNMKTLAAIGREHTPEQTVGAFELARSLGFSNINMDIIAGLPGETADDFQNTMDGIERLSPDGLTVHTLALKRASRLSKDDGMKKILRANETGAMCEAGRRGALAMGMRPYYLYRQKNCVGNHENVSYCVPGAESPYNIHIMEEDMTVLACGAGASTKIVNEKENKIVRFFNTKSVDEYLSNFETVLGRKDLAFSNR